MVKMVPSTAGPSWMRRFGGRSVRRLLLLFLWICLAYGLFVILSREIFAKMSHNSSVSSSSASSASSSSSSSSSLLGSSSSSSGFYSDIDLLKSLNSRLALTAPSTLYLAPVGSSLASAPSSSVGAGNGLPPASSSLSFGLVSDSSSSLTNINSNIPSISNSISSSSSFVSNSNSNSNSNANANANNNWASYGLTLASIVSTSSSTTSRYSWLNEDEPLVDKGTKTIEDLILEAAGTIRNIPPPPYILANTKDIGPKYFRNSSCARFPTIYDLEFSNTFWQTLRTSNGTLHMYGAYFDVRARNRMGPSLRILGMMDRIEPNVSAWCQIWFEKEREPVFSKVFEYKYIWFSKWGNYRQGVFQPYLLACQVPKSHHRKIPSSVSVVEKPCHSANNNLRVLYTKPKVKDGFAVCVKGLDFLHEDLSVRLVEWIEMLGILGANKIFFYELAVHPNITKVLRYYQKTGQIDVTPLTLPGGQPNDPRIRHIYLGKKVNHKRQNEVIPYNDCLYRNLYQYEYIALLDIDEVIMPMKVNNWKELMADVDRKARQSKNVSRASYNFRNIYFLDDMMHGHQWWPDIPKYLHMLQHVYRSKNFTKPGQYVKCFHNPERVITLHNHFPLACLNGSCTSYPVGTEFAQLQHYRADCVRALKNCKEDFKQNSVLDTTIWKYKDELIERANKVLKHLGFIQNINSSSGGGGGGAGGVSDHDGLR